MKLFNWLNFIGYLKILIKKKYKKKLNLIFREE